jgi:hypothetical protein
MNTKLGLGLLCDDFRVDLGNSGSIGGDGVEGIERYNRFKDFRVCPRRIL